MTQEQPSVDQPVPPEPPTPPKSEIVEAYEAAIREAALPGLARLPAVKVSESVRAAFREAANDPRRKRADRGFSGIALEVLCRVFDDGADTAMQEWRDWYKPEEWLSARRALGGFIRQRIDRQFAALRAEVAALKAENAGRMTYLFAELPFPLRHRWGGDAREFAEGIDAARSASGEDRSNG